MKLGDLDDFLSPAADCVVLPSQPSASATKTGVIKSKQTTEETVAAITLSDCLACSGCVTSAETLLLQSQSVDELLSQRAVKVSFHFTLSSASRRALSEFLHIPASEVCDYIRDRVAPLLLPSLVVVTDVSVAEAIVVAETVREARSSSHTVLTSHCPGWTCYASKILDESVLSRLSKIKSAEQVYGLIVKRMIPALSASVSFSNSMVPKLDSVRHICNSLLPSPTQRIHHIYISPCFDKKLEIIRPDYSVGADLRAVDLVLSSTEIVDLMNRGTVSSECMYGTIDIYSVMGMRESWACSESAVESGGYAQAAAQQGGEAPEWTKGKNSDFFEFKSYLRSNGFRNIQNVSRRIKTGKLDNYKLVEVMACPGGCPRGGGQPVPVQNSETESSGTTWDRLWKYFYAMFQSASRVSVVDHELVDTVCEPNKYRPALALRSGLVALLGSEKAFQSVIRTEWKSLIDDTKVSASSLRW